MVCCGDDDVMAQGVVRDRRCRDLFCLIFFLAYWAGMIVICVFASKNGDTNRLVYGVDSYGFTCGSKTTYLNSQQQEVTIDNEHSKFLYTLNPVQMLNADDIPFVKSVCYHRCPGVDDVCNAPNNSPCKYDGQFVCPYYAFADYDLYGKLGSAFKINPNYTDIPGLTFYYSLLRTINSTYDPDSYDTILRLQSLNIPWVNTWLVTNNIDPLLNVTGAYYQLLSQFPGSGPCYPVYVPTTSFANRCFPNYPDYYTDPITSSIGTNSVVYEPGPPIVSVATGIAVGSGSVSSFRGWWNDATKTWARYVDSISQGILIIVVAGLGGGVLLSLFWMVILRYLAGFMAWLTLTLVNVALVGITLFCFNNAGMLDFPGIGQNVSQTMGASVDPTQLDRTTWYWIGIGASIVTGLVLLLTLLCISRIKIAVACIKVASQAVGSMPAIMLFPIIPMVLEAVFIVYWVTVSALLYTAGNLEATCRNNATIPLTWTTLTGFYDASVYVGATDMGTYGCYGDLPWDQRVQACGSNQDCYISYKWDFNYYWMFLYHFFGLLWTNQFLIGISCVTVAGAIGSFYWSGGDSSKMPDMPVVTAFKDTFVYHLGSVAKGSHFIAWVHLIRFAIEFLDRQTKNLQAGNSLCQWCMCCVHCCGWVLTKIVTFINRTAYIIVGVKGTAYCPSALRASSLIVSNALRLAAVNAVGDVLLFLGKTAIAASCGCIAFAMWHLPYYSDTKQYPQTYIPDPILAIVIAIIVGYVVAEIFFSVYEMAIDTIILSFCDDCDANEGNPKYPPPMLEHALGIKPRESINQVHQEPYAKQSAYPAGGGTGLAGYAAGAGQQGYPGTGQQGYPGSAGQAGYPGGPVPPPPAGPPPPGALSPAQPPYPGGAGQQAYPGGAAQQAYPGGAAQQAYPGGAAQQAYPGGGAGQQAYPGSAAHAQQAYPSQAQQAYPSQAQQAYPAGAAQQGYAGQAQQVYPSQAPPAYPNQAQPAYPGAARV